MCMWRKLTFLLLLAVSLLSGYSAEGGEPGLFIIAPRDGNTVPERPYISGRIAEPNAEVWVIVHPMEVSDYWVQPRTTVKEDGSWKVSIYIGRPGSIDIGKRFEIRAIANPKKKLREGSVLDSWPEARWKSQVLEVIRK